MNIPCKFRPLGDGGLPPGYTRVDFLENTGGAFIDTGIIPNNETGLLLDAKPEAANDEIPFGCRNINSAETRFYAMRPRRGSPDGSLIPNGYGWGRWFLIGNKVSNGASLVRRERTSLNWLNDRSAKCEAGCVLLPVLSFAPTCSMFMFAANINNAASLSFMGKIWEAGISEGAELKAKFIPTLDPSGTPCMFDLVARKPFRNVGSGQFVVGMTLGQVRRLRLPDPTILNELTLSLPWEAEFDEQAQAALHAAADKGWLLTLQYAPIDLPEFAGYVRADYLETTGYQWLQVTDLHLGSTSDVNMKFAPTDMTSWFNLFYCMSDASYNRIGSIQQSKKIRYDYINQGYVYSSSELTGGSIYHVRQCGERNFLNGIEQASNKASNFTINAPTLIGKAAHSSILSHMRIFWFKAAANSNVYAIPAIDPNGTPCMFDIVSKTPCYDAGTSGVPFTVGLTKAQAETLVLGEKASGLTIAVPAETDLTLVEANNPGITLTVQTTD